MAAVLITGAAGFLGTEMVRVFREAGHDVRAADHPGADLARQRAMGAEPCPFDVTDRDAAHAAVRDVDVVVHAAGIFDMSADPDLLWRVNADGAEHVARAAVAGKVKRFVMISSTSVYGRAVHLAEDAPKDPGDPYAKSKWAGEELAVRVCGEGGLPIAVLRPTLIYGPGGRYGLASWLAVFALRAKRGLGKYPIARGGPLGHHVHVADVARASLFVAMKQEAAGGAFNVADDAPMPGGDLVRVVAGCVGAGVSDLALPWWAGRLLWVLRPMVEWYLRGMNGKLARIWTRIVDEHKLVPALSPRVDAEWMDYILYEHSFETRRLKDIGFRFEHPDVRTAYPKAVEWYREQRWIP